MDERPVWTPNCTKVPVGARCSRPTFRPSPRVSLLQNGQQGVPHRRLLYTCSRTKVSTRLSTQTTKRRRKKIIKIDFGEHVAHGESFQSTYVSITLGVASWPWSDTPSRINVLRSTRRPVDTATVIAHWLPDLQEGPPDSGDQGHPRYSDGVM